MVAREGYVAEDLGDGGWSRGGVVCVVAIVDDVNEAKEG